MDRFVTRAPTWKTKNYSSSAAVGCGTSKTTKKARLKELDSKSKPQVTSVLKPLQETATTSRRLSIRDERLLKLFASQPDQPLVEINSSDSGCSSSSDGFPVVGTGWGMKVGSQGTENTAPSLSGKNNSSLHDPTESFLPQAVTQQQKEVLAHNAGLEEERCRTPQNAMLSTSSSETDLLSTPPPAPIENRLLQRIQHDLNSPSASLRVRALRAIQSPTKSSYAQFDVSHNEQSIITAEERRPPEPAKSIQELMQDIRVYVEVRSGEDNRSAGVKKVISALGAKVNDKLLRDTTHVIFKDGLLSTYKKAKNWNIPVVSILWVESCKNQRRICPASEFTISNVDRYENPELYEKMKRHKSMQPDSEVNKRVRVKATTGTPKNSTPRTCILKKTSTLNTQTPTTPVSKKKTDISRFFEQLSGNNKPPQNPVARILFDQPTTSAKLRSEIVAASPATELLNNTNSIIQQAKPNLPENPDSDGKTLLNSATTNVDPVIKHIKNVSSRRRSTIRAESSMRATINGIVDMSLEQSQVAGSDRVDTPLRQTRRRSCVRVSSFINATKEKEGLDSTTKNQLEDAITEEDTPTNTVIPRNTKNRKTTYTPKPLEISEVANMETDAIITDTVDKQKRSMRLRRQTLSTSDRSVSQDTLRNVSAVNQIDRDSEMSVSTPFFSTVSSLSQIPQKDNVMQTPPQQTGSLFEQHAAATVFSSTRLPGRRRTLFDVSMDIITQRLQNINQSARRSMARPNPGAYPESPPPTENNSTPILSRQNTKVDMSSQSTEEQQQQAAAADVGCTSTKTDSAGSTSATSAPSRKRKLFVPNEYLLTPPNTSSSTTSVGSYTAPSARRRRTLMPLPQAQLESKAAKTPTTAVAVRDKPSTSNRSRRSTMDFEDVKKSRTNLATLRKFTKAVKETNAAVVEEYKQDVEKLRMQDGTVANTASTSSIPLGEKRKPTGRLLVYTNLHTEQVEVINEALEKLGHFQLEKNVGSETTHVVSLEPRRTMNMLRALLRGLWILEFTWVKDSLQAGKWLNEESYEMRDFSRSVEICRSERQAFGKSYNCELFSLLGPFYVPKRCGVLPKAQLVELIRLSGGKVVEQRKHAKYIVGDTNRNLEDKIYITPNWIVDSITQMQIERFTKYPTGLMPGLTASQPLEPKIQNIWQPYSQI